MPLSVNPIRSLTTSQAPRPSLGTAASTASGPAATSTSASNWGGYPSYPSYPNYPGYPSYPYQPQPSIWNAISNIGRGLGELAMVVFYGAGTVLSWVGTAAVAILGVTWEVLASVGRAVARGFRAIFNPGYPTYPGYPGYPGYPSPYYPYQR
ncbi:MAG: hypothetical protein VKP62_12400 [Candidatus Sericytochromatia bacterium]|nr:hypothetical protein [Candidatus Sericytochromatia bacterium]